MEIFLGDYVDRGPQSRDVVEWMISASPLADERHLPAWQSRGHAARALFDDTDGHGELAATTVAARRCCPTAWPCRGFGGETALVELQQGFRAAFPSRHLRILRGAAAQRCAVAPYLFVHAGIRPGAPLDDAGSARTSSGSASRSCIPPRISAASSCMATRPADAPRGAQQPHQHRHRCGVHRPPYLPCPGRGDETLSPDRTAIE